MKLLPLYDRVLVKPLDKKTGSGIVLAGSSDRNDQGEVVAVGPGPILNDGTQKPLAVQVGDTVMFVPGTGHPVKIDGEDMRVFPEFELVGILREE